MHTAAATRHGMTIGTFTSPALPWRTQQWRRAAVLLSAAIAWLCSALGATAQTLDAGEFGLPRLLEISELSDLLEAHAPVVAAKWSVVEQAHAEYAERYAQVLTRELAPFTQAGAARDMAWFAESQRRRDPTLRKLIALENAMLDAIRPAVDEARVGGLERVRRRRAASWYEGSLRSQGISESCFVDISKLVYSLDETKDHRDALTSTLESYESSRAKDLAAFTTALMETFAKFAALYLEVRVVGEEEDPQRVEELWEELQQRSQALALEMAPKFKSILEDQRRIAASIVQKLPAPADRAFADRFLAAAYPGLETGESLGIPAMVRRALRLKSLTAEEREQVQRIEAAWWQSDQSIAAEAMDGEDARSARWFAVDGDDWERFNEESAVIQSRRHKRADQARSEIAALLGDDRAPSLTGAEDPALFQTEQAAAEPGTSEQELLRASAEAEEDEMRESFSRVSLSRSWRDYVTARAALEPSGDVIFSVLWDDLESRWRERSQALLGEALALQHAVRLPPVEGKSPSGSYARLAEIPWQAASESRNEQAAFLAEVSEAVPSVDASTVRCASYWIDCDALLRMRSHYYLSGEVPINLPRAMEQAIHSLGVRERTHLASEELATAEVRLRDAVAAIQSEYEGQAAARAEWQRIQAEAEASGGVDGNAYSQWFEEADRRREACASKVGAAATASLAAAERVAAQLPPEERAELERLVRRERQSMVLERVPSLEEFLAVARQAAGDNAAALAELDAVAKEALPEYERLIDELVTTRVNIAAPDWSNQLTEEEGQSLWEQHERRVAAIREVAAKLKQLAQRTVLRVERLVGEEALKKHRIQRRMKQCYFQEEMWWLQG